MNRKLESARVRTGIFASSEADGFNGYFQLYISGERIKVIASDGEGWQHVSISKNDQPTKTPNWSIMCEIKNLFWGEDVWVVQYHPSKSDYVNNHPGCLHLWRPTDVELPVPPSILTGWKEKTVAEVQAITRRERLLAYQSANFKP